MGDIKHFGKIMWEQLLNLYIKGSEVPWGNLYRNNIQKIHLPTYSFVKNHVWIDYKNDCSNGPEGLFHI